MGSWAGLLYSLAVAVSALGALNANTFATGRLCVAGSKRGYLPDILANLHMNHQTHERDYYERRLRSFPRFIIRHTVALAAWTAELRIEKEIPVSVSLTSISPSKC